MNSIRELKSLKKELIYEKYTRIVFSDYKDYEKVTRAQMLEEIIKTYQNYEAIGYICSLRELDFLAYITSDEYAETEDISRNKKLYKKYRWEINTLRDKLLIDFNVLKLDYSIPEEIVDSVKQAVELCRTESHKTIDRLVVLMAGFVRCTGEIMFDIVADVVSTMNGVDRKFCDVMGANPQFRFFVFLHDEYVESIQQIKTLAVHEDCYQYIDEINEDRRKYGEAISTEVTAARYESFFYNGYDLTVPEVKDFIETSQKNYDGNMISLFIMMSMRYHPDFDIEKWNYLDYYKHLYPDLFEKFKKALYCSPTPALNGASPKELDEYKQKEEKRIQQRKRNHNSQKNAKLSREQCALFYRLFFSLMDFINRKYSLHPETEHIEILQGKEKVIWELEDKMFEDIDTNINDYIKKNPLRVGRKELDIIDGFRNGIKGLFVMTEYERDYTAFQNADGIYMAKGLVQNIDEIIDYMRLPLPVLTTLYPFQGKIVYNGLISPLEVKIDDQATEAFLKEYRDGNRVYSLKQRVKH